MKARTASAIDVEQLMWCAYYGRLTGRSLTGENRSRRLSTGGGAANSGRRLPVRVSPAGSIFTILRGIICIRYSMVTVTAGLAGR